MDVIELLEDKKKCLRRFLEASEDFVRQATEGDLSGLPKLEAERESLVRTLGLIDRRITDTVQQIPTANRTRELSSAVRTQTDDHELLIQKILTTDNKIAACIEAEKQRLAREIAGARKQHELTGKFKSSWVPESGEELDSKA